MAVRVTAIHVFFGSRGKVDARNKSAHDDTVLTELGHSPIKLATGPDVLSPDGAGFYFTVNR